MACLHHQSTQVLRLSAAWVGCSARWKRAFWGSVRIGAALTAYFADQPHAHESKRRHAEIDQHPFQNPVRIRSGVGEQLSGFGKEVAIAAQRLGCRVIACDRYAGAPAMQVADVAEVLPMTDADACLLYTSPSPRDLSTSRMPSSA